MGRYTLHKDSETYLDELRRATIGEEQKPVPSLIEPHMNPQATISEIESTEQNSKPEESGCLTVAVVLLSIVALGLITITLYQYLK